MSNLDRESVSVASRKVIAPSIGAGTLGLVAILALGAGMILGGIVIPFLRADPPDQSQTEKLEAEQAASRVVLFSISPQTIYAPLRDGGDLVSTGFSVEQYLTELEVRASQAGLAAEKLVTRQGDQAEISYVFSQTNAQSASAFPLSKVTLEHPKTLVLTFSSGPLPGTIALRQARVDGKLRRAGASFVDFVQLGATPPDLAEGQFLTARGVFEIKVSGQGVAAFLDGEQVYPTPTPSALPKLGLPKLNLNAPNGEAAEPASPGAMPRRLALQSFQPAIGVLKDRLILIASDTAEDTCSAKAVILDVTRNKVLELEEPLETPALAVTNDKDGLILNGFCAPKPEASADVAADNAPKIATLKQIVRLSARYDLKTGALAWQREIVTLDPLNPLPPIGEVPQVGPSNPWRAVTGTRLASPLISGGALVSVACRAGGGVTIAVAGLPAPLDGLATGVRFDSGGRATSAQMKWRASVTGYELDGGSRPNEARAVLDRLRAGGELRVSAVGASKSVPAPGRAQIDTLMGQCDKTAAPIAPSPAVTSSKPKPVAPAKPPAKPPVKPAAKPVAAKPITPKPIPPKSLAPKPMVQPKPKPKPETVTLPKPKPKSPPTPNPSPPPPPPPPPPAPKVSEAEPT